MFNDSRQAQYALFALWALFSTTNLIRVFCVIQLLYLAVLLCSVASRCRSPQKTAHIAGAVTTHKTAVTAICWSSNQRTGHKDGMGSTAFASNSC